MIKHMVENAWWRFGRVEIINKGKVLYVFQFETKESCQAVMQQLWHINNRMLLLRKWRTNLDYVNLLGTKVPLWIKLEDVLWHYGLREALVMFPLLFESLSKWMLSPKPGM